MQFTFCILLKRAHFIIYHTKGNTHHHRKIGHCFKQRDKLSPFSRDGHFRAEQPLKLSCVNLSPCFTNLDLGFPLDLKEKSPPRPLNWPIKKERVLDLVERSEVRSLVPETRRADDTGQFDGDGGSLPTTGNEAGAFCFGKTPSLQRAPCFQLSSRKQCPHQLEPSTNGRGWVWGEWDRNQGSETSR